MIIEVELEKLEYRGLRSTGIVLKRLNKPAEFVLLLSDFTSRFLGPYLVTLLKDDVHSNTVVNPARVTTWGWVIRSLWLPSLLTFHRSAVNQGRDIELFDDGDRLGIMFSAVSKK